MIRGVIDAGICGKKTTVEAVEIGEFRVRLKIDSDCEIIAKIGKSLAEIDLRDAMKSQVDSVVYKLASKYGTHASCPVPMAILKAMEVEVGIALARPVFVRFEAAE